MDKNKLQGKIREQMHREIRARREFQAKWSFMASKETNKFYDQSHLNSKVAEIVSNDEDVATSSGGESYFTSKAMYEAMNVCRCGRKKQGVHLTKCMQKCVIKYSEGEQQEVLEQDSETKPNIPRTANEIHGFFPCKYLVLERSTFHISSKANLKYKITDPMYNNIIIG